MQTWIDIRREFQWLGHESIYLVDERAESELMKHLSMLGFRIAILDGKKISDEVGFFKQTATVFKFPEYFGHNWDAFGDCFGDIIYPEKRLAIIWKHASVSLKSNFYMFFKAAHELLILARGLGWHESPDREHMQIEVFFVGEPPKFSKRPK